MNIKKSVDGTEIVWRAGKYNNLLANGGRKIEPCLSCPQGDGGSGIYRTARTEGENG